MTQTAPQKPVNSAIVQEYSVASAAIVEEFHRNPGSRKAIAERAALLDGLITRLYKEAAAADLPAMAVMAVGGYGRGELFFYSDVDLLFLVQDAAAREACQPVINAVLYALWDVKLKVGHSVATPQEAVELANADVTVKTSLLEARRVCGSKSLAEQFEQAFAAEALQGQEKQFIEAKMEEWSARHRKFGDSRAILEPNVKEGKGGLRDLQTLMWLMRACYGVHRMREIAALGKISAQELADFRRARKFLHLVRLHLHDISGRAEERLTFDAQRQIAERLGYRSADNNANQSVERFMKRYFQVTRTVGQLTRTLCFLLEEEWGKAPRTGIRAMWQRQQLPEGLVIEGNRLAFASLEVVQQHPALMVQIFWFAHRLEIDIHPASWQVMTRNLRFINAALRQDAAANDAFLNLLLDVKNPDVTLKRMNEAGVLGRFIPDFGLLAGQMQFDLYHTFTVDEHILTAIGYLHQIESGDMAEVAPLAGTLFPRIQMRRVLYLALFCHDIAKGRGGNHHLKGVAIGDKLAARFGFDAAERSALAWLIEHHQDMSMVAFKRNLDDPQTIESFAAEVKSLQQLMMLYVLTIADIHAVAPQIWNSWKGTLLESLYRKTEGVLGGRTEPAQAKLISVDALREQMQVELPTVNPADITDYLLDADAASLESYDVGTHSRIFPCWLAVKKGDLFGIRFRTYAEFSSTRVTIATQDKTGLFAQIAGVFAVCGANITEARIGTRKDGIIVDRFSIQDHQGKPFEEDRRQDKIRQKLRQVLVGELDLEKAVLEAQQRYPTVASVFRIEPKLFIDNEASTSHTLLEIHCADRLGLLYRVARALTALGLSISAAHIATYGEKVVDVFYVKDGFGHKLVAPPRIEEVRQALLRAIE